MLILENRLNNNEPVDIDKIGTEQNSEDKVVNTGAETEEVQDTEGLDTESTFETETGEVAPPSTERTEENNASWTVTNMDKTMYAKSSVNVRKGPGPDYSKLGSLKINQEVKVTGKCNEFDWYRIDYNGNEAYVSSSYLINEKILVNNNNNTNSNTNNNADSTNHNINNTENKEENNVPSTPEPEWGTIKYEKPNDGWNYMPIYVWDNWSVEHNAWGREVRQTTFGHKEQDWDEVFKISEIAYPLRTDTGIEGQRIEYPTIWVYFGEGPKGR